MAHRSPPRSPRNVQRLFEIVLDDSCSIICDDVPVNCTIRVAPVEGRNPPRLNPVSQWMEDFPPPHQIDCSSYEAEDERDRGGRIAGSPGSFPQSPIRSRRNMVESVRRNLHDNSKWTIYTDGSDDSVFCIRSPCQRPDRSYASSSSIPTPGNADADRFLEANRPQRDFRRENIMVGGPDMPEIHAESGSLVQGCSTPSSPQTPFKSRPGEMSPSAPPPPPSSRSPPSGRCCAMADYNPSNYQPRSPDGNAETRVREGRETRGEYSGSGQCSYHNPQPCPALANSRCRANLTRLQTTSTDANLDGGLGSRSPELNGARSCRYHDSLPCPVMAGVRCRAEGEGERIESSSRSASPSKTESKSPELSRTLDWAVSHERSGGAKPPKQIAPPPRTPRSRSPATRAPMAGGVLNIINKFNVKFLRKSNADIVSRSSYLGSKRLCYTRFRPPNILCSYSPGTDQALDMALGGIMT